MNDKDLEETLAETRYVGVMMREKDKQKAFSAEHAKQVIAFIRDQLDYLEKVIAND